MAENISKALDALIVLKNFCKEHSCCEGKCPFYRTDISNKREVCTFLLDNPCSWEKPFIPKYSPAEMLLLRGFYANGYTSIRKDYNDKGVVFENGDGEKAVYFPSDSFGDIPVGVRMSLKELITLGDKYEE